MPTGVASLPHSAHNVGCIVVVVVVDVVDVVELVVLVVLLVVVVVGGHDIRLLQSSVVLAETPFGNGVLNIVAHTRVPLETDTTLSRYVIQSTTVTFTGEPKEDINV